MKHEPRNHAHLEDRQRFAISHALPNLYVRDLQRAYPFIKDLVKKYATSPYYMATVVYCAGMIAGKCDERWHVQEREKRNRHKEN